MAKLLKLRRGTTTQHGSFTGEQGEVTVDTDKTTLVVHPGGTQGGGEAMLREDLNNMPNSGVTAGTYGSSSAIPAITVDAKGLVTSATTSAIDSTSISNGTSNVSVAASGNITAVRSGTQRLTVTSSGVAIGGALQVEASDPQIIIKDSDNTGAGTAGRIEARTSADEVKWRLGDFSQSNEHLNVWNNATSDIVLSTNNGGKQINFTTAGHWVPADNNAQDLGTSSSQWRNAWFDGTVNCDDLLVADTNAIITLKDTDDSGTNAPVAYVQAQDSNGSRRWFVGDLGNSNPDVYLSNDQSAALIFRTGAAERCYVNSNGHLQPWTNNTYDLGTSTHRWRNVYTNDLNLSNEGGTNDVDGTWGSWTIQEGEDDLFLLNRRNGKKYKFNLSEVN